MHVMRSSWMRAIDRALLLVGAWVLALGVVAVGAGPTHAAAAPSGESARLPAAVTVPGVPTGVKATAGDRRASLAFVGPAATGGAPVTNYQFSLDNGATWKVRAPVSVASPLVISGLVNGVSYKVRLRAVNSAGPGAASAAVTVVPKVVVPSVPRSVVATAGDRTVSLAFVGPAATGGAPVTNYQFSLDNGATWKVRAPVSVASPLVISGLVNGVSYKVRLRAVNSAGPGAASAAVTVVPKAVARAELTQGQWLRTNEVLQSPNKEFSLVMQGDGNLVLYRNGGSAIWDTRTNGAGRELVMQSDGNLVMYAGGKPIWSTGTADFAGARLAVQDDGNVVVYLGARALWSRHSGPLFDSLGSGQVLRANDALQSRGGGYRLVMQSDGNLVLYRAGGGAIWDTRTNGSGRELVMQSDGNLVMYAGGQAVWDSKTFSFPNVRLYLQDDGNLVLYSGSRAIWSSNSGVLYDSLRTGQWLRANESLRSIGGQYHLVMQGDGNLVLYRAGGGAVWDTKTNGSGRELVMQSDGNLVMYAGGQAVWSSGTAGVGPGTLVVQGDGNVVIYAGSGAVWDRNRAAVSGGRVDAFVARYNGRFVDFDGLYGAQCFDLFNQYARDVLGAGPLYGFNRASEIYDRAPASLYDRIPAGQAARKGDVAVWNNNLGGGYGHVAIVLDDLGGGGLRVFQQNGPRVGDPANVSTMGKGNLRGYLRPKV